ncbi:sugar kinase [Algoriphagus namhaensis]|uniref:Sugar kinase n=1 Tax=Algoriphagus namhaensis TaxID=915353 RepID=A0ABV8AT30_9BACT
MKKIVTLGEVMLRLSPPDHQRFFQTESFDVVYGGSEANVGSALSFLGNKVIHLTSFPEGELGDAAIGNLRKNGLDTDFIQRFSGRMGIYFLEQGAMQRSSKIIYDRSDSVFAKNGCKNLNWDLILENVDLLHWSGITPALSQETANFTLEAILECRKRDIKVCADPSFRSNLWKYGKNPMDVMPKLLGHSQIIIGGLKDFKICMGMEEKDMESLVPRLFEVLNELEYVVDTNRISQSSSVNEFSAVLFSRTSTLHSKNYTLSHIIDRVGTGDAFAGGLLHGLLNEGPQSAIELGVAAAVLKHSVPGDLLFCSLAELKEVIAGENIGKIKR